MSGEKFDFSGKIKDGIYDITARPRRGVIRAEGSISKEGYIDANFRAYHIDLGGYDLVCDGILKSEIVTTGIEVKAPVIKGSVDVKNCMLNYKPFLDLKASYQIADGNLSILDTGLSDVVKCRGTFQLREPFNINATLTVNNLSLSWLALTLGLKDASSILSGTTNAKCDFRGTSGEFAVQYPNRDKERDDCYS